MEWLFFDTSLMDKHRAVLDKIKWYRSLYGWKKLHFTIAAPDALNPKILDPTGEPVLTPHSVYVDNDIYLNLADCRLSK